MIVIVPHWSMYTHCHSIPTSGRRRTYVLCSLNRSFECRFCFGSVRFLHFKVIFRIRRVLKVEVDILKFPLYSSYTRDSCYRCCPFCMYHFSNLFKRFCGHRQAWVSTIISPICIPRLFGLMTDFCS